MNRAIIGIELAKGGALGGVALRGLGKVFPNGVEAVAGLDLSVAAGEFLAVVGPSGSGKSTLLRLIAGLETPTAGSVSIAGADVTARPPRERDVAMVFQEPALFPYLSVFDNLAFGLRARGIGRAAVNERVKTVADMMGLEDLLGRRPETLSGGQRQRVALGRAVACRPVVFLLDEPLSRLDAPLRASLRGELSALHRRLGATMIFVTHDQAEALALGDRVAVMDRGRIVQVGSPSGVYREPATMAVAGFIGIPPMRFHRAAVVNEGETVFIELRADGDRLQLPAGRWVGPCAARQGRGVVLGLRPEHARLAGKSDARDPAYAWLTREGEVIRVEYQGHESAVVVASGAFEFNVRVAGTTTVQRGDRFAVGLDLDGASWFDPDTGAAIAPEPG